METDLEDGDAALGESWRRRVDLENIAVGHDVSPARRALAAECSSPLRRGREEENEGREGPVGHREGLDGSSVESSECLEPSPAHPQPSEGKVEQEERVHAGVETRQTLDAWSQFVRARVPREAI